MKFLLDTHLLLWAAGEPQHLSQRAKKIINNKHNTLFFSVASLWEVIIKNSLGRKDFCVDARLLRRGLLDNGYLELPVCGEHVVEIDALPAIHKDPFDRILIAQSKTEGITLLTADSIIARYKGSIELV